MKLLILDKDGTLVKPKSGNTFVQSPNDQELIEGVAETLEHYRGSGWIFAIASNQGGVAAGYKTIDDAMHEMMMCVDILHKQAGAGAWGVFCPDHGASAYDFDWFRSKCVDSDIKEGWRKPDPQMLLYIIQKELDWGYTLDEILFVGDRPEDEQAAKSAGINFMWAHDWIKEENWP